MSLDLGANEPDSKERQNTYKEIQQILSQDMPVVNLFELEFLVIHNKKLKGAFKSAMGPYSSFATAWLQRQQHSPTIQTATSSSNTSQSRTTSSAELLAAQRKAEELEQQLSALKAQQEQEQQTISNDTQIPLITIASATTKGAQGVIRGRVNDNTGIAELRVDGQKIAVDSNGNFSATTYVPEGGV